MLDVQVPRDAAAELAAIGRFVSARGWVPATGGNFSRRIDKDHAAVTRSGIDKGNIRPEDLIAVPLQAVLNGKWPAGVSAETPLHISRYFHDEAVGAVLHVHTVAATVLSRIDAARGYVELDGFEMQKSLRGITSHETTVRLPIFSNDQDTERLAERIEKSLPNEPVAPGYLLAGHGLYAWGADMVDAQRHLEGLEFLLRCALEERRLYR
jgi:methylthioribulose-1-phosphate dehydratase